MVLGRPRMVPELLLEAAVTLNAIERVFDWPELSETTMITVKFPAWDGVQESEFVFELVQPCGSPV